MYEFTLSLGYVFRRRRLSSGSRSASIESDRREWSESGSRALDVFWALLTAHVTHLT